VRYACKKAAEAEARIKAAQAAGKVLCVHCYDYFHPGPWEREPGESILCHACDTRVQMAKTVAAGVPLHTEEGGDVKCNLCNSRFPDKKAADGSYVHTDCE
jgi:NMD protein affecting ribosome stability and mRNA decay